MDSLFAVQHSYLIPLLPLVGAVLAGFFGAKFLKGASHWPIWIGVFCSAVLSFMLLFGTLGQWGGEGKVEGRGEAETAARLWAHPSATGWFDWIQAGDLVDKQVHDAEGRVTTEKRPAFDVQAGAWIDPLTVTMLCVVCGIGFLITVFAAGYMKGEEGYFRFFAYLGLFIFAMTCLVMGNNFIMLYLGWEGVGLCSYLLIGYYYERPAAREAAKKAFLVNRIGDFGFALGIMLIFLAFGSVSYFGQGVHTGTGVMEMAQQAYHNLHSMDPAVKATVTPIQRCALQWVPFLLMLGAFGKSAQFPLYVWLPDAMEGPTPVSALIHAATMVTAGVYMIARCSALFVTNEAALVTVAFVGAFTALFAATIALRQFDLKKVFAYSTISQLGFMFVAVGVLAPVAGVFHLITHAFFKALLFLSSGVVMHAMAGELDMRKMSGLKRILPKTNLLMIAGCAALAGFPFITSGFYSKDEIVGAAFNHSTFLGLVMLFTAFLTAYYTFRLYFRVFQGPEVLPDGVGGHGHGGSDAHGGHGASPAAGTGAATNSLTVVTPTTTHEVASAGGHPATEAGGVAGASADRPADHAGASASAVQTGTAAESGVDEHLKKQPVAHAPDSASHSAHGSDAGSGAGHGGGDAHGHHNHEPAVMMVPLYLLAIGAILAGFLNWPERPHNLGTFLGQSPSLSIGFDMARSHYLDVEPKVDAMPFGQPVPGEVEGWSWTVNKWMLISAAVALAGIGLAYALHLRDRKLGDRIPEEFAGLSHLLEAKYWVDEIYQALIVAPLRMLGRVFFRIDRFVIDGIVWVISIVPQAGGLTLRLTTQRGFLQGYAAAMLFGIVVILLVVFW